MNYDPFPMSGTAQADIVTSSILVQCELDSSHHKTGENVKNVKFYNQLSPNSTRPSPAQSAQLRTRTEL